MVIIRTRPRPPGQPDGAGGQARPVRSHRAARPGRGFRPDQAHPGQCPAVDGTRPGARHRGRPGRRPRPGAYALRKGAYHLPALSRSARADRAVRPVRQDIPGHGPRHGRGRRPGAASAGGRRRPGLPTLEVGNSAAIADDTYASKQDSYHIAGEAFDTAVGTTGTQDTVAIDTGLLTALNQTVTVDGKVRTGLMQSRLQSAPAAEIGGPLVNLNGQVIGITVAGAGTGLKINGSAIPINQALAIAKQIDARARHTS
jgi:hypothetical protein